jgi:hypothetical protein
MRCVASDNQFKVPRNPGTHVRHLHKLDVEGVPPERDSRWEVTTFHLRYFAVCSVRPTAVYYGHDYQFWQPVDDDWHVGQGPKSCLR